MANYSPPLEKNLYLTLLPTGLNQERPKFSDLNSPVLAFHNSESRQGTVPVDFKFVNPINNTQKMFIRVVLLHKILKTKANFF